MFSRKVQNTPTGALTNPKNFEWNKNYKFKLKLEIQNLKLKIENLKLKILNRRFDIENLKLRIFI